MRKVLRSYEYNNQNKYKKIKEEYFNEYGYNLGSPLKEDTFLKYQTTSQDDPKIKIAK